MGRQFLGILGSPPLWIRRVIARDHDVGHVPNFIKSLNILARELYSAGHRFSAAFVIVSCPGELEPRLPEMALAIVSAFTGIHVISLVALGPSISKFGSRRVSRSFVT